MKSSVEFLEPYRGVTLYKTKSKYFPYNGNGILWESATLEGIKKYIDNALDSGTQYVNDRGALMFK
jgi:hypothetical protein